MLCVQNKQRYEEGRVENYLNVQLICKTNYGVQKKKFTCFNFCNVNKMIFRGGCQHFAIMTKTKGSHWPV